MEPIDLSADGVHVTMTTTTEQPSGMGSGDVLNFFFLHLKQICCLLKPEHISA